MASPFSIATNPNLLYLTAALHGSLAKIRFSITEKQGLALVMSDFGHGKTTFLRYLHAEYTDTPELPTVTTLISTGSFPSAFGLLRKICEDFAIPAKRSQLKQHEALEAWLFQQYIGGKTAIVFLDESQALSNEMLEMVRTLLNFESHDHKLLQLVLAGSLDLQKRLQLKRNRAVCSRVFAPCTIAALTLEETTAMIQFRCERSSVPNPFSNGVIEEIHRHAGGVPRDVLRICNHAWFMARSLGREVTANLVASAVAETAMVAEVGA